MRYELEVCIVKYNGDPRLDCSYEVVEVYDELFEGTEDEAGEKLDELSMNFEREYPRDKYGVWLFFDEYE